MVVFILSRNLSSKRIAGDIQSDIENITGFNVKCEHNKNWCEQKLRIFDEIKNKKRAETSRIIIHPDVKKQNGQPVTLNDIIDSIGFGNGVTTTQLKLKNGEKIPVVYCVFPHGSEGAVNSKLAQLKGICTQ